MGSSFKSFEETPDPNKNIPKNSKDKTSDPRAKLTKPVVVPKPTNDREASQQALDVASELLGLFAGYIREVNPELEARAYDFAATFVQQKYPHLTMRKHDLTTKESGTIFSIEANPAYYPTEEDFK